MVCLPQTSREFRDGYLTGATKIGGVNRTDITNVDPYIPCENMYESSLFGHDLRDFTKIYCSCGRLVDYESNSLLVKKQLHKVIECPICRTQRILAELDLLDEHFCPIEEPAVN